MINVVKGESEQVRKILRRGILMFEIRNAIVKFEIIHMNVVFVGMYRTGIPVWVEFGGFRLFTMEIHENDVRGPLGYNPKLKKTNFLKCHNFVSLFLLFLLHS